MRNSDGKVLYMNVAQIGEMGRNTLSVHLSHIPRIANMQYFTSGSSVRKHETQRILSRMFSPFASIT